MVLLKGTYSCRDVWTQQDTCLHLEPHHDVVVRLVAPRVASLNPGLTEDPSVGVCLAAEQTGEIKGGHLKLLTMSGWY